MPYTNHADPPLAAKVGGVVWVALLGLSSLGQLPLATIELIFLLAPLVIIPLGLRVVASSRTHNPGNSHNTWAQPLQPFGATLAILSFCFSPGIGACLLASGWLIVCSIIGLCGLLRLWRDWFKSVEQICSSVGLLYLPVDGAGLVASRLGMG